MYSVSAPAWTFVSILGLAGLAAVAGRFRESAKLPVKKVAVATLSLFGVVEGGVTVYEKSEKICERLAPYCAVPESHRTTTPAAGTSTAGTAPNAAAPTRQGGAGEVKSARSSQPSASKSDDRPLAEHPVKPARNVAAATAARPVKSEHEGRTALVSTQVATHVENKVFVTVVNTPPGSRADDAPEPALVIGIKTELKRLGCLAGEPDGSWTKEARNAVGRFNTYGHRSISDVPEDDSLPVLRSFPAKVCP